MKTITTEQLKDILLPLKGTHPVCISTLTDAKAKKTGNPFGTILKFSKACGVSGADFEQSVNRQLEREGKEATFEAQERTWGQRISSLLVENKGEYYLVLHVQHNTDPLYFVKKDGMLVNINKTEVEAFLPTPSKPKQADVEKTIIYRNYALKNVKYIGISGQKYRISSVEKLEEKTEKEHELTY